MARTKTAFAVMVLMLVVAPACGHQKVSIRCEHPGAWPYTAGAQWTARVIDAAGYERTDCTGSAFVIDMGGSGAGGHDLYIWARRGRTPRRYSTRRLRVGETEIQYDRIRATWQAGEHVVWIEAGPTTRRLLPPEHWRRLIRASLEVD
jgi:hypothetical protein